MTSKRDMFSVAGGMWTSQRHHISWQVVLDTCDNNWENAVGNNSQPE